MLAELAKNTLKKKKSTCFFKYSDVDNAGVDCHAAACAIQLEVKELHWE